MDWGVLDKDGQWIEYKVSEEKARESFDNSPAWRLVKNIETDKVSGSEKYEIVEEN